MLGEEKCKAESYSGEAYSQVSQLNYYADNILLPYRQVTALLSTDIALEAEQLIGHSFLSHTLIAWNISVWANP